MTRLAEEEQGGKSRSGNGHGVDPAPPAAERARLQPDTQEEPSPPDDRETPERANQAQAPVEDDRDSRRPPVYKRPWFWIVAAVVVIVGTIVSVVWWLHARRYVSTDDAFIAAHVATVSPRIAGHVIEVLVDDNQDVKQGQILVRLDPRDLQESLNAALASRTSAEGNLKEAEAGVISARATVAQAAADVTVAQANANQAQSDLKRYKAADPRAVSKQALDAATAQARMAAATLEASRQKQEAAEAQVKVAESKVETAKANLHRADVSVSNARLQFSYTDVVASVNGRVTGRNVEVGAFVQPGQTLMSLVPREVWVAANYKETQLKRIHVGQPVKISVDAFGMKLEGHVQSIQAGTGAAFSLLPPENATGNYVKVVQRVPVKITIDKLPDRRLAPGMSVEPTVDTKK